MNGADQLVLCSKCQAHALIFDMLRLSALTHMVKDKSFEP